MSDYSPRPEHKFTFGLWTVGNRGVDPFGSAVREHKTPAELVYLLGEVGAGNWPDVVTACRAAVKLTGSTLPDPAQVAAYRKAYPLYRELYPALKASFEKMK